MRRGVHPSSVVVDTKMSTLKPHVLSWLREGFQELSNTNIMDGWARGGYLACWQPELQEEACRRVLAGEVNLFDVSQKMKRTQCSWPSETKMRKMLWM